METELNAWRKARRNELLSARTALPLEQRREWDERITDFVLRAFPMLQGMTLGLYWPFKGEVDPRVAALRFRNLGARTALPVVVEKRAPLEFREWHAGVETRPGVFDLPVPVDTEVVVPDAVFIPPVGIDRQGYRLGYGGGYFDRTLAAINPRPLAIALARESSRIDTIQPQSYDVPMDFVVTEVGVHHAGSGRLERIEPEEATRRAEALRASRRAATAPRS
jgi:5,10-methenyltetrahydrofolate synthetase